MVGFWLLEVKPPGPVQLKLLPLVVLEVRISEVFEQFKTDGGVIEAPGKGL